MTRRVPLKRTGFSSLRQTPLAQVSDKRIVELRTYAKKRKAYLESHPVCERCHEQAATDIHHTAKRYGGLLNVESLWRAVCRRCHDAIHHNPKAARAKGWLV
jgi:nitrate/TMAO reductase-like tetraheme cytochrome c subunit